MVWKEKLQCSMPLGRTRQGLCLLYWHNCITFYCQTRVWKIHYMAILSRYFDSKKNLHINWIIFHESKFTRQLPCIRFYKHKPFMCQFTRKKKTCKCTSLHIYMCMWFLLTQLLELQECPGCDHILYLSQISNCRAVMWVTCHLAVPIIYNLF